MKGHILKLVMAIMIAITLVTCTKFGKNITVKGRVINPITNEPISGITVFMHQSWKSKTIKKMVTGQDGEFELSATHLGHVWAGTNYANYQDYYDLGWDYQNKYYSEIKVNKGKTMNVDYHLVPYGEIKTPIHNINCGGGNDTLIFKRTNITFPHLSVFQPFTLTGCYNNEGAYAEVPSGDYKIEWTVIRNGVSNTYSHILTVPGNGQASYNIEY
ncbi:MAG TPA: hypothetical protein PLP27_10005 [Crocinitomicaceae bacterium]|nr:hypothetical protein [Crocinitomicaceae bacterium]